MRNRNRCSQFFPFLGVIFTVSLLMQSSFDTNPQTFMGSQDVIKITNTSKKWVVITSVNYPTEDVKRLASLPDWKVVVVADTKTPKDWNLAGVHFLSVEKQLSFGLSLPNTLPFKTYTRKNVGYLYAIMNGADWIYDTDDDNKPYGLGLEQFDYEETVSGLRYTPKGNISEKLFNPYRFFGYKDMWPRGFPLEYISDHSNGNDRLIICREMKTAAVQQGIVHKDPDVDAIFRLLHADRKTGLNVTFNKHAPPVLLEAGTYAPWNSQNTLFHRRAFFTMFLPTTVEFRVTDIWRSYFSQKMLHLIGESVAFYPVNAVQNRNAHNFLEDFEDEAAVYTKSGKIVHFIENFTCSSNTTQKCFMELAEGFANHSFIQPSELQLMEAWINNLEVIGYQFPPLSSWNNIKVDVNEYRGNCRSANIELPAVENYQETNASSRAVQKIENFNDILFWCDGKQYESQENSSNIDNLPPARLVDLRHSKTPGLDDKKDTVLVLINNYPWKQSIGLLQRLYSPYFATTIFCGSWNPESFTDDELPILQPVNFVNLTEDESYRGFLYYYCVSKVRDLRLQNVKGYFFASDDALFNIWHLLPLDVSLNVGESKVNMGGFWWETEKIGKEAAHKFVNLMETQFSNDDRAQKTWKEFDKKVKEKGFKSAKEMMMNDTGHRVGDFFYVSEKDLDFFANMGEYMAEAQLFVEIALNKIFQAINYIPIDDFKYLWGNSKDQLKAYNPTIIGLHPLKLSYAHSNATYRKEFCSTVISSFYKNLFEFH